jgi:hypothetical protein
MKNLAIFTMHVEEFITTRPPEPTHGPDLVERVEVHGKVRGVPREAAS